VLKHVAEGTGFAAGDYAIASVTVKDGDAVVDELPEVPIGGPTPRMRGFDVEGLGAALEGKKPGDLVEVDGLMATDMHGHGHGHEHGHEHEHEGQEGHDHDHETRKVRLAIKIGEVKRRELPELDDQFAQEVGEQTVLGMRVSIRKKLTAVHEREAERDVDQKLLDELVDRASFEMASGPVDRALGARLERLMLERMIRGESEEAARAAVEADRAKVRQIVERDAKAWLIVEKLAKKEKIFALEDDVAKEIAKIAEEQGTTPTKVRESYEAEGVLPELRANVLERKVLDFLKAHGSVIEAAEEAQAKAGAQAGGEEGES
jgi:FKBP-type peptidyl-prolyl cis-trans isomerase (trigger factor)